MKGKILDYNIQNSTGIISGDDGQRYNFTNKEWKGDKAPSVNQKVDFEIDEKNAKSIYLESSSISFDADSMKSKMSDIQNSDFVNNGQKNINKALKEGVQNKFGFIIAILTALALFLPIIKIPFLGSMSLVDGFWGKVALILVIISSLLFYTGAKKILVKATIGIAVAIIFFQFYDLLSGLSQGSDMMNAFGGRRNKSINLFGLLQIGTYVIIPLTILLFISGFKSKYKENN